MKRTAIAILAAIVVLATLVPRAAAPISVMILDGESGGPWHEWQRVTPVLKKVLDETGLFTTTVVTAPPRYDLYYLWAIAGDERKLAVYEDPAHRWVHSVGSSA